MKTLVLQSFRTHDVPAWLERCMQSVRDWSALRGYEYRFMDDAFFDILPAWFPPAARVIKTLSADHARVLWAQRLLGEGWDRFVWVDADVLVFAPDRLEVDSVGSYGFCHEVLAVHEAGALRMHHRINNSLSVYGAGNPFLDFYAHAVEQLLRHRQRIAHDGLGTVLLSGLGQLMPLPVLFNVGLFSPLVVRAVVEGDRTFLRDFMARGHAPLAAGNFCQSLRGQTLQGMTMTDALFESAVGRCLAEGERLFQIRPSA